MPMTPTRYEHELDELREQRDELLAALKDALATIRAWHSIHGGDDPAWLIYVKHAPEMKRITAAITKADSNVA